jgi:hypothetical protein
MRGEVLRRTITKELALLLLDLQEVSSVLLRRQASKRARLS